MKYIQFLPPSLSTVKELAFLITANVISSVLNFVGRMPSRISLVQCHFFCLRALLGILWVENILSQAFCGSEIFFRGYFVGLNFFLVGTSWLQSFFVYCGSKLFFRGYFTDPKFFFFFFSWARNFSREFKIFSRV